MIHSIFFMLDIFGIDCLETLIPKSVNVINIIWSQAIALIKMSRFGSFRWPHVKRVCGMLKIWDILELPLIFFMLGISKRGTMSEWEKIKRKIRGARTARNREHTMDVDRSSSGSGQGANVRVTAVQTEEGNIDRTRWVCSRGISARAFLIAHNAIFCNSSIFWCRL